MPAITFSGNVMDAAGAPILLIVTGENGEEINEDFAESFEITKDLSPGEYIVTVSAFAENFVFDIMGDYSSITPEVPDEYGEKTNEIYLLMV